MFTAHDIQNVPRWFSKFIRVRWGEIRRRSVFSAIMLVALSFGWRTVWAADGQLDSAFANGGTTATGISGNDDAVMTSWQTGEYRKRS